MSKSTQNMSEAFVNESLLAARNTVYAQKAEQEGNKTQARVFTALAKAQEVRARKILLLLRGKLGNTEENLQTQARALEQACVEFPRMLEDARVENTKPHVAALTQFCATVTNNKDLLATYSQNTDTSLLVCRICGFIAQEHAPEKCPVCSAVQSKFFEIE